jgi:hypothetical protein
MIEQTAKTINDNIILNYDNVRAFGIAEKIVIREANKQVSLPVLLLPSGECLDVFVDDKFRFGVYHRLVGKTYKEEPRKGFGDEPLFTVTADMRLVCWGFISKDNPRHLEAAFWKLYPKEAHAYAVQFDTKSVFVEEIQGQTFFIPQDAFLFSVRYKIIYETKKQC